MGEVGVNSQPLREEWRERLRFGAPGPLPPWLWLLLHGKSHEPGEPFFADGAPRSIDASGTFSNHLTNKPITFESMRAALASMAPPLPLVVSVCVHEADVAEVVAAGPGIPVHADPMLRLREFIAYFSDGSIRCGIGGKAYECRIDHESARYPAFEESAETDVSLDALFIGSKKGDP